MLDFENFEQVFKVATGNGKTSTKSVFDDRTEEASAVQYFQVRHIPGIIHLQI